MAKMPEKELQERHRYCVTVKPTAPAYVASCSNVQRECELRQQEQGKVVCSVPKKSPPKS